MNIQGFVTSETANIMEFAAAWREHNLKEPEKFPLDMCEWAWFKQYLAFCARQLEQKAKEEAKKAQHRDAA